MFQGIWISLEGIYFLVKINNFGGMGRPSPPPWKIPPILLIFLFNPSLNGCLLWKSCFPSPTQLKTGDYLPITRVQQIAHRWRCAGKPTLHSSLKHTLRRERRTCLLNFCLLVKINTNMLMIQPSIINVLIQEMFWYKNKYTHFCISFKDQYVCRFVYIFQRSEGLQKFFRPLGL